MVYSGFATTRNRRIVDERPLWVLVINEGCQTSKILPALGLKAGACENYRGRTLGKARADPDGPAFPSALRPRTAIRPPEEQQAHACARSTSPLVSMMPSAACLIAVAASLCPTIELDRQISELGRRRKGRLIRAHEHTNQKYAQPNTAEQR
jgi:hypothetical protein